MISRFLGHLFSKSPDFQFQQVGRSETHTRAKEAHTAGAYPGFCSMIEALESIPTSPGCDAKSIAGLPPSSMSLVPFYTPGLRETMWGTASCRRKQHDGRNWALSHQLSDLKSNVLTTASPTLPPHPQCMQFNVLHFFMPASYLLTFFWVVTKNC